MRFWRIIVLLLVLLSALTHSLRAFGAAGESPSRVVILLPDATCGNPCWQGIRPRQTSGAQAEAIFRQLPQARELGEGFWVYVPESGYQNMVAYLEMITLTADRVQIGAVMAHIGAPAFQTRQLGTRIATKETQELVRLFYPEHHMILVAAVPLGGRLSPRSAIAAINFVEPRLLRDPDAVGWFGFIWIDRYPPRFGS
jgi:hypothetical protein